MVLRIVGDKCWGNEKNKLDKYEQSTRIFPRFKESCQNLERPDNIEKCYSLSLHKQAVE